jgi:CubicO group peptidase (beta-lactamase class C family)
MVLEMAEKTRLMGLDERLIRCAFEQLDNETAAGEIPGGVVSIGRNGHFLEYAVGHAVFDESICLPALKDTLYDCASLTKVTATLPLVLQLLDEGRVRLEDPVCLFIPEFAVHGKSSVTVRHLLTHSAGLTPFTDMHSYGWTRTQILDFVVHQTLAYEPGTQVLYSDIGFIVLGHLVSLLFGMPLEDAARKRVFEPLDMTNTRFCPSLEDRPRIAATERYPLEEGPRWGIVHDENAHAMGGISGHAGLFSTARDLSHYASMWMEEGVWRERRVLSRSSVRLAIQSQTTACVGGNRGLGWVLKGDKFDASGDLLSEFSYGHTGYTGTSVYVDPASRLTVVLLTNRVHFGREKSVTRLRACLHNAVAASLKDLPF